MLSLLATLALAPQFFDETVVEPARYASASGGYTLAVEPSARDGSGPCQVRMERAGAELWSRELPFTFVGASVTSGGQVVGYAFDEGVDVGRGFLHEVVLDARGGVLQDRRTERGWCRYVVCPPPPEPNVLGLVLDEEHDRAIVRIADDDWTRAQEQWRVVRISTGEPLEDVRPTAGLVHDEEQRQRVWAARALPGTDLFLLHARTWTYKTQVGSVFALVDLAGRVAWRLDLPHDLELERAETEDLKREQDQHERRVEEHGCLLAVPAPRTFDAWFVRAGQRVRFEARPTEDGGWEVLERERHPFVPPPPETPPPPPPLVDLDLELLGEVALERVPAPPSPVQDVVAWERTGAGTFACVRREEERGRFSFLEVDADGRALVVRAFEDLPADPGTTTWTRLSTGAWLFTTSPFGPDTSARLFRADPASGAVEELALDCPGVEAAAACPDGGFVLLVNHRGQYTSTDEVLGYTADLAPRLRLREGRDDPAGLFAPEDVAVTTDGRVLVLDNVRKTIQQYTASGQYLATIELAEALGQEPNYPTQIRQGPDGAVLLCDFHGEPPLWLLDRVGAPLRHWTPGFPDGRPVESRRMRFAPDGELWADDGHAFLAFDGEGLVRRQVGAPVDPRAIRAPAAAAIDELGRPCVQDERTGSVHAWDLSGREVLLGVLPPERFDGLSPIDRITAWPDGGLQVGGVRWDASGRPREPAPGDGEAVLDPRSGAHWTWDYHTGLRKVDADGQVLATLDRSPDRTWLRDVKDVSCGPDGDLAVVDPPHVLLVSPAGAPLSTCEIPPRDGRPLVPRDVVLGRSWVVLGVGWKPEWVLQRRADGAWFRFAPDLPTPRAARYEVGLSADGRELLVFAVHELRVLRYRLP